LRVGGAWQEAGDVVDVLKLVDDLSREFGFNKHVAGKISAFSGGFKLEGAGGYVVFKEALTAGAEVTVSGKALTMVQAGGFFNWSVDGDADDEDATTFASGGWKEFDRTLLSWSGSAEAHWGDTGSLSRWGRTVVVSSIPMRVEAQDCLEGFAIITGDGIESPVEGLVDESIDFQGTGPLYIRMDDDEEPRVPACRPWAWVWAIRTVWWHDRWALMTRKRKKNRGILADED